MDASLLGRFQAKFLNFLDGRINLRGHQLSAHCIDDILVYFLQQAFKALQGFFAFFADRVSIRINKVVETSLIVTYYVLVVLLCYKILASLLCYFFQQVAFEANYQIFSFQSAFFDIMTTMNELPNDGFNNVPGGIDI